MNRRSPQGILLALTLLIILRSPPAAADPTGQPSGMKSGYAPINGPTMYYEIHGQGRPLVLLHGGGSTIQTSFGTVLPGLALTRQIIAVEQEGHGRTADIGRPYSFEQSAEDTVALLNHLGIAHADFYGYSNGGNIAMEIAVRYPRMVRRIVLAAAISRIEGMPEGFSEQIRQAKTDSMPEELREAYLKTSPHPDQLPQFVEKCARRMIEFKDWPDDHVKQILCPTLILVGDRHDVRPEHALFMHRLIPNSQLAIFPNTDHMLLVKRTDLLLATIPTFLDAPDAEAVR
jgi:pimeloyl-ACP methyl ester carboxylesterase